MKVELEARNLEQKGEAEKIAEKLDGQSFTVLRQAAEGGQLYGSVSPRDLAALVSEKGFAVSRAQIALNAPIKTIGLHKVPVSLHPEVEVAITVMVARNADEAARLARGEDITVVREEDAGGRPRRRPPRRKPSSSPRWSRRAVREDATETPKTEARDREERLIIERTRSYARSTSRLRTELFLERVEQGRIRGGRLDRCR